MPFARSQTQLRLLAFHKKLQLSVWHIKYSSQSADSASESFNHLLVCGWSIHTIFAQWRLIANSNKNISAQSTPPPQAWSHESVESTSRCELSVGGTNFSLNI